MSNKNKNNKNGAKSENQVDTQNAETQPGSVDVFHPTKVTEFSSSPISELVSFEVPTVETESVDYVLESGIPIPPPTRKSKKYQFEQMVPGQSFVVGKKVGAVSVTINYWKKKLPGRTFVSRSLSENEICELKSKRKLSDDVQEACRVWRTDGMVTA